MQSHSPLLKLDIPPPATMLSLPVLRLFFNLHLLPIINQINVPQVVFIHSENETSIDPTIFTQLSSQISTWQVSLTNKTLALKQTSALFIWTRDPWTSLEVERGNVRQLRQMSLDAIASKFLILQRDVDQCEALLRLAWAESMLDVTILDPRQIHHYNPFSNEYSHQPHNSTAKLFPDKLLNLHDYKLKVGIVDYPPYSGVAWKHDGSYDLKFIFGELLDTLSTTANFSIQPEVVTMKGYGVLNGTTGSASGLIGKIWSGELDLVAFGAFLFYSPFGSKADRTTYIIMEQGCAVVPLIPLTKTHLLMAESLQTSVTIIVILVVVVYVFSLLLRLDKRLWHPFNVLFLILGITVQDIPKVLRDRCLYGSIMVVSLFYSSNIFAQLTNINLDTGGFEPFDSYEDLDSSGLVPVLHPNILNITFRFTDDKYLRSLDGKAEVRLDVVDCCPNWLKSNQNVSCVLEGHMAKLQVKMSKNSQGNDVMKISQPCFWSITRSFLLIRASPYTDRFNRIIRMVEQAGLQQFWFMQASFDYKRMKNVTLEEENGAAGVLADKGKLTDMLKDDTHKSARYLVVVGCIGATFVFLGEILVFRVRMWKTRAKVHAQRGIEN